MSPLDILCPMHLRVDRTGHITHAGPTVQKLHSGHTIVGQRFLETFALRRPRNITTTAQLRDHAGSKLHLQMRQGPETQLKGVLVPSTNTDDLIVNLSFGISIAEALADYPLTSSDFAPTDLAIEMLYLIEAKSAAMEASRKLNLRLQGAKIAAEEKAYTDALTGLKNRRALDYILDRLIEADQSFALMQVDLDFFKAVNDSKGHAAGDFVLQTVAQVMLAETRETDTVARMGGDEFTILMPNMRYPKALTGIGRRIIDTLEQRIVFQGESCRISASIGTAFYQPGSRLTAERLIENADIALYASKRAGRAQQSFYTEDMRNDPAPPAADQTPTLRSVS